MSCRCRSSLSSRGRCRIFTTAPYTGPSHASLLTGQNPPRHGLRDYLEQALPAGATTLAEMLRDRGYQTAAFVSTYVLDPRFGLDQGFDVYDSPDRSGDPPEHGRPGPRTVTRALAWLHDRDPDHYPDERLRAIIHHPSRGSTRPPVVAF